MTLEQIKEKFNRDGVTISAWAKEKGFNYRTTIAVVNGVNKGNFGEAHRVAVALGLKKGVQQ